MTLTEFSVSHSQVSKRTGIQNGGEFRLKLLYPFAPTIRQRDYDYELNIDRNTDNFWEEKVHHDSNLFYSEKNTLLYRGGFGIEYCLHKRIPVEFGIKSWKFRKDWDSNFVQSKGYFTHVSFPMNVRYEICRHKFFSIKAGLGIEPYIKTYSNFAVLYTRTTKWFLFFPIAEETKVAVRNSVVKDSNMTFEMSFGFKLDKRISADIYIRAATEANYSQININYLLN